MKNTSIEDRLDRVEEALFGTKMHTSIAVIQDKSHSMTKLRDSTINGFNEYVSSLKDDKSDDASLTLIQFDTSYNVRYANKPVARVADLNVDTYVPDGMTALYDAIGRAINELSRSDGSHERKLVVIMTDGQENASREYDFDKIKALIEKKQESGNWTFVFLGAGIDEFSGRKLGIPTGNVMSYDSTPHMHTNTYSGLASATGSLRGSTSAQSKNFTSSMTPDSTERDDLWTPGKEADDDETTN